MFDIPAQVLHTMLNWVKAKVTEEELQTITQIRNLYEPDELVRTITTFCLSKETTLTRGKKSFEELFS